MVPMFQLLSITYRNKDGAYVLVALYNIQEQGWCLYFSSDDEDSQAGMSYGGSDQADKEKFARYVTFVRLMQHGILTLHPVMLKP